MKKWCQSRWFKGILIGVAHISAIGIVIILMNFLMNARLVHDASFISYLLGEKYEDTRRFEEEMWWLSYEKLSHIRNQPYFEEETLNGRLLDITNGYESMVDIEIMSIDGEKIMLNAEPSIDMELGVDAEQDANEELGIDVEESVDTQQDANAELSTDVESSIDTQPTANTISIDKGIFYRIEDLIKWSEVKGESNYYDVGYQALIVVCQKSNGTYDYYYYDEFEKLVQEKQIQLVSDTGETSKEILQMIQGRYYDGLEQISPLRVLDEQEELKYEQCWTMEGVEERYLTADGRRLLDIAMNESEWNGRLWELINELESTLDLIFEEHSYYNYAKTNAEKDSKKESNFSYMLVDLKNERVDSNVAKYTNFEQYEQNIKQLKNVGKYVKINHQDGPTQTNLRTGLMEWEGDFQNILNENYIYIVSVDTSFGVQDEFYEQKIAYEALISSKLLIVMSIAFLTSLIFLTIVAGRKINEEGIVLQKFDHIKSEWACGIIVALGIAYTVLMVWGIEEYSYRYYSEQKNVNILLGILTFGLCAICLMGYLSLVRRIKAKTLWKNSVLKSMWEYAKQFIKFVQKIFQYRKSTTKLFVIFGGLLALMLMGLASYSAELMFIAVVATCAFGVLELRAAIATQKIRDGLKAIVEGNLDYKIPVEKMSGDQKEIAERINSMSEGLESAIEKSMKDERLKTELITNVSHDIKTPLTSIINYVDLLKRENFQDKKIQGYLKILEEKAQRLKTLTEDVVEASKVTSGNIQLEFTTINLVEMVQQSEGEFERKFKERNLQLIMNYPQEPVLASVDGKYMWRVFENLFSNVAKYAMEGTRVYGELQASEKGIIFSIKNISATQLNITEEELTERFIRGDVARTTEGNGLGLSIAKSLVELQGGKMSLAIDGDLFKATIELSKKL